MKEKTKEQENQNEARPNASEGAHDRLLGDVLILEHDFLYCCGTCNEFYCVDIKCNECGKWFSVYATDGEDEQGKTKIWDVESASKPPEGLIIECCHCHTKYKAHDNNDVLDDEIKWIQIKMTT